MRNRIARAVSDLNFLTPRDESLADDLNKERGIVRGRVALLPRSAEIQPRFYRFVFHGNGRKTFPLGSLVLSF